MIDYFSSLLYIVAFRKFHQIFTCDVVKLSVD